MVKEELPKMVRVWLSLIIPPILLAIITMIVATYIGIKTHGASGAIAEGIVSSLPYISDTTCIYPNRWNKFRLDRMATSIGEKVLIVGTSGWYSSWDSIGFVRAFRIRTNT